MIKNELGSRPVRLKVNRCQKPQKRCAASITGCIFFVNETQETALCKECRFLFMLSPFFFVFLPARGWNHKEVFSLTAAKERFAYEFVRH
jgi:hypothetical protein